MRIKHVFVILVLLALALPASPAQAAGVVTVCDEAHLLATLGGGGIVTFACSGTIALTSTITIAADTTMDGSGQDVTISGNNAVRVLTVNSGVTLNLNRLTIANGHINQGHGGGIHNSGTVTIYNSTFSGNNADEYGGGILNFGTLTVNNSIFSGNSAYDGGGIFNYSGPVTVSNSTFSDNIAGWGGGAIFNYSSTLALSNCTISGNFSSSNGGGIAQEFGAAIVSNSTFSSNSSAYGGGISSGGGTVMLKNTIVGNNTGGNCSGTVTDGGGNLSYPDTSCPGINTDPMLGPLQMNGGPSQTMALRPGSAAIDGGIDANCAAAPVNNLDQRGLSRPWGSHCDIGAVEQRIVSVCDEAHLLAALAGGGTVFFTCSGTITLSNTIVISTDTTIDGSGQDVNISGNDAVRVLTVNPGVTLTLNRLSIAQGYADGDAGGIYSERGTVIVLNSAVSDNRATSDGGGIFNAGGTLLVSHSTFAGNSADGPGGGIRNDGTLAVANSVFSDNHTHFGVGGGIYNGSTATVSRSTFTSNSAESPGGGIYNSSGVLTVSGSTFDGNGSNFWGGGISNAWSGTVTVANSTFAANSADYGGGLANRYGGAMTVINSTMHDGGIHNESDSTVTLKNTVVANSSTGSNCTGNITDGGGNLSYPDTTCPGINADPLLGPLQDNGGPTWTMALGPGSAAIDTGNDATCAAAPVNTLDQRGVVRPQGAHCDIGALEQLRKWLPIMLAQ